MSTYNPDDDSSDDECTECPTCGQGGFASGYAMRNHHAHQHGESLTVSVTCANCGEEHDRIPSEVSETNFCDHSCHGEWLSGENHHNWGGGKVETPCTICGAPVKRYPKKDEEFDRAFCSDDCHYQWVSENLAGENHSLWKGGVSYEYVGWRDAREKALERDGYTCRACGITMDEHREKRGSSLDVHHIVPVRKFDDERDAHDLENLVTACRRCHSKYEGLPVFPM